jgi:malate dehydrogenase (oxaloacetate-decarboxylating)
MADKAIVFGKSSAGDRPHGGAATCRRRRHGAQRLPQPDQQNSSRFLASSGGLLYGALRDIADSMLIAAAVAIADRVAPDELNASYFIPSVFDSRWLAPSRVVGTSTRKCLILGS